MLWIFYNMWVYFKILALAKQLDWSERQVERWLRLRRTQDKPSMLTKFCENRLVSFIKICISSCIEIKPLNLFH